MKKKKKKKKKICSANKNFKKVGNNYEIVRIAIRGYVHRVMGSYSHSKFGVRLFNLAKY